MYIKYSVRHYVIREPCMRRQVEKWSLISKFFLFLFLGSSSHVSHAIFAPLIGAESENCKNKSVNNHKLLLLHFHLYHVRLVCFFFLLRTSFVLAIHSPQHDLTDLGLFRDLIKIVWFKFLLIMLVEKNGGGRNMYYTMLFSLQIMAILSCLLVCISRPLG